MHNALETVNALRKFGAEATAVEAKRARDALPKTILETLSSFSNTPGGGTIILGVDETSGFSVTGVNDPKKIMADLGSWARDDITPPLRPEVDFAEIDGKVIVVAEIAELPRNQRPAYVKARGLDRGAYIRVGDGDRRLTSEEVHQLVADRGQPIFDHETALEAELSDLDATQVARYTERLRAGTKARIFANESDEVILRMTKVVTRGPDGQLHPTFAGLLALGRYPQEFFPQVDLTFVAYPTADGNHAASGIRFLDNASIDGPIPLMVQTALAVVQRNMKSRSLIVGAGRRDIWEYPPTVLREAIVNALVHRDLSPGSRGTQVQIEMYPDRLRIMNPGGLFGAVDVEHLGDEGISSARNASLLKILEDVQMPDDDRTVCENRGSGVRSMMAALREAGMSPPIFRDRATSFEVTIPNHTLLDERTVAWLQTLGKEGLSDSQCNGLALMLRGEIMTNSRYRAATGIADSNKATKELQDLVARELIDQIGLKRGARYTLSAHAKGVSEGGKPIRMNRRRQIRKLLETHGELSKREISTLLGLAAKSAEHWLRKLKAEGMIEATVSGPGHKDTKYRLTSLGQQEPLFSEES